MTAPTPSRDACGDCRHLLTYRCPCQAPKCRRHAVPGGADCVRPAPTTPPPTGDAP